ncbi:diacylglycerol kinase [Coprothermobacter proteolyticus]|uniref:diacylglycerol kinase n=1 Tax=Coprothermobacter proteolyticus TaxID=35786 RepID=UPI000D300344|nr:diacylglycerol kinase [Coprothermobacter proteolyticus]
MKNLRLVDSFRRAVKGIKNAFLREYHIRVAFFLVLALFLYSLVLGLTLREWLVLVTFSSLVVCLEMINSALEKLADAVHPDWSEQVGFAKDLAAGAVLVSIGAAAAAGLPVYVLAFSRRFSVTWTYSLFVNLGLLILGIVLLFVWDFRR